MLVVVTGASGGLGSYVAQELYETHDVVGTYHTNWDGMPRLCREVRLDVTDERVVNQFAADVVKGWGENGICLLNMAGIPSARVVHKTTLADWVRVLDVNLTGSFLLCKALLPAMRANGGRIINFSSVTVQMGVPGAGAYAASKAGIEALTKVIAMENAKYPVTANCLSLGYFDRGMIDDVPEETRASLVTTIPVGHLGDPSNIVSAVRFLMEADYVTGQVIAINGGLR